MAVVVVGGHARGVGKTSVVCGLIAAMPEHRWTALKITQHGHHICTGDGARCDCATPDHSFTIIEERDSTGTNDTSRYLQAGAAASFWVSTRPGSLAEAMPRVREIIGEAESVILESNSVMAFLQPDVYLVVLNPGVEEFKPTLLEFLDRASALLVHHGDVPEGRAVNPQLLLGKRAFAITRAAYVTPEVVDFVRGHRKTG